MAHDLRTIAMAMDVSTADFDEKVLRASATRPVLVDFWAPWCGPCRALAPLLDRLAAEFADRFTLAKLNTDEEPEIAARYGVRGIPNCKLFVDGNVVDEFTGVLPEPALRDFFARALPSPAAPLVASAQALLAAGDVAGAYAKIDEAVHVAPNDEDALLTRIEILLAQGRADEAQALVTQRLAGDGSLRDTRRLATLAARATLAAGTASGDLAALAQAAAREPIDCAAKLAYARALAASGDYESALRELLAIVNADRAFGDDAGRRTMLTIFDALPADSDLVRRYRRELASALH
jgi:putative thioredoxin